MTNLSDLEYHSYIDENGQISEQWHKKIGIYAIFDQDKVLQFVGYSRDIYSSLKQHLVQQPQSCYWLKVETIERPSRSILEEIKAAWIAENGSPPMGNAAEAQQWTQSINVKPAMTEEEQSLYQASEEFAQGKLLKKVARRVEEQIKAELVQRGVNMEFRFDPKLKEKGLLTLK